MSRESDARFFCRRLREIFKSSDSLFSGITQTIDEFASDQIKIDFYNAVKQAVKDVEERKEDYENWLRNDFQHYQIKIDNEEVED